jgi:GNAT superfamily N-acetyltransferase
MAPPLTPPLQGEWNRPGAKRIPPKVDADTRSAIDLRSIALRAGIPRKLGMTMGGRNGVPDAPRTSIASAFTIRPYEPGDEAQLLPVWNAAMWADPIDVAVWRGRYLLDPNFDPRACPVAIDAATGDIVGYLLAFASRTPADRTQSGPDAWVVGFGVAADHRRRGVGRAMHEHLVAYLRQYGVSRIQYGPYVPTYLTPGVDEAAYPEAIAFLVALGAETQSRPLSMKASLTGYRPNPETADTARKLEGEGVRVRPVEPADILPLLDFLDSHFPHWRGDATGVLRELVDGDPGTVTMHVAVDGDTIVGYAQSRAERFGPFGVNEACRGRGIGAVLLSYTLLAMRARGFHCAWFMWTSDRAAKLYRQHGFEEVRRFSLMTSTFQPEGNPG